MRINFYITGKLNKQGSATIYCMIRQGKRMASFQTGLKVKPENWCKENERSTDNEMLNTHLIMILNTLYKIILETDKVNGIDPVLVVRIFTGKHEKQKIGIEEVLKDFEKRLKLNSTIHASRLRRRSAKYFIEHTGSKLITGHTHNTSKAFELHLTEKKKYKYEYVQKIIEQVKNLFKYAKNEGLIDKNPFEFFRPSKAPCKEIVRLSSEEILKIENLKTDGKSWGIQNAKDCFLFQCYTGLSECDLRAFEKSFITVENGIEVISARRIKTGQSFFIPFSEKAKEIAERLNYQLQPPVNAYYNRSLKQIAKMAGIEKRVTTHVGRKSFAQSMIDKGFSPESVAKMMGHEDFKMTRKHYARVDEKRILKELFDLKETSPKEVDFSPLKITRTIEAA